MSRTIYALLLIGIFILAFVLRFYKLGEIPNGLYQDETAIGYNAYSILQTGKDEYGKVLPLYFKSFGDYKLPVYIYLTAISIKAFGLNEFAVRFPSALFGFLTVVVFYFFIKQLSDNKKLAIAATALLAINPWHLHYSRATFEVSICLFLFVIGTFLIQLSFDGKKAKGLFLLGTLFFVIALYTYNLTRLLAPFLYVLVLLFHKKDLKKISRLEFTLTAVLSILPLIPFMGTLFGAGGVSSVVGTFIFSSASVQAPLLEFKSYFINSSIIVSKLFFNKILLTLWQYLNNIALYFSVPFFFISGSTHGNHGIGNVGLFYLFEFPLILLGIVTVIVRKYVWGYFLIAWSIIVVLIASLTRDVPHATRSFFLITPMIIFSALGLLIFLSWMQDMKSPSKRVFLTTFLLAFVSYNILYYFESYYVRFPVFYAKAWRTTDKDLSLYLKENENRYEKVIFDRKAGFIYTSLLFYTQYPPAEFQSTVSRGADDSEGFSEVRSFGKYEFADIDWNEDILRPKKLLTLLVTKPDLKPHEITSLKTFSYPSRPIVIAQKQEIFQYPSKEAAYVVVETK